MVAPFLTPGAGPVRRAVEQRTAVLAVWLHGRRRWLIGLIPLASLVGLLAARGPIALLPGAVLTTLVAWTAYLSWPTVPPGGRAGRLVVLAALMALTAIRVGR